MQCYRLWPLDSSFLYVTNIHFFVFQVEFLPKQCQMTFSHAIGRMGDSAKQRNRLIYINNNKFYKVARLSVMTLTGKHNNVTNKSWQSISTLQNKGGLVGIKQNGCNKKNYIFQKCVTDSKTELFPGGAAILDSEQQTWQPIKSWPRNTWTAMGMYQLTGRSFKRHTRII